jgi:hypothetical protein
MTEQKPSRKEMGEMRGKTPDYLKNQEHSVDLSGEMDDEIEKDLKHEIMRVREIVLEQDRLAAVLRDKFTHLQSPEALDAYCGQLGVEEGVKKDFQAALPRIIESLERGGKVLPDSVLEEEADSFEEIYRALGSDAKELFAGEGASEIVERIVSAEIDLALNVLQENRSRKRLSHRERGFGADEASAQSLEGALVANVGELEFDIRMSKDHKCIIHHNSTLGESSERPEHVRDLTEAELSEVTYKGGDDICTLERLFELVKETENTSTKINIDIKDFDEEGLNEILQLIHDNDMEHRVAIVSWLPQSLQYLYEKDPTLEYSMSYFPVIRGIPRFVVEAIENIPSGSRIFGKIGTWFAKLRAGTVRGVGSENITDATVLQADEHYKDTKERMDAKGEDLVGRHTVPYADLPVADAQGDMSIMARVLQKGSVNIMALEPVVEKFVDKMTKIPLLGRLAKKYRDKLVDVLCATESFVDYAQKLSTNGVKVNIFDITEEGHIDKYIEKMKKADVEPGVVYYSGQYEGLNTRGQVPDIKQNNPST